jgi:hypothetical protein
MLADRPLLSRRGLRRDEVLAPCALALLAADRRRSAAPVLLPLVPLIGDDDDTPPSLAGCDDVNDEDVDGPAPDAAAAPLVPEGLGGRMVGVPALPPVALTPRCLGGGRGDVVPIPVTAAANPDLLVLALVVPLAASNLGGRTGVTTASVIASMGARIHVAKSLQSGRLLAEDDAAVLELPVPVGIVDD